LVAVRRVKDEGRGMVAKKKNKLRGKAKPTSEVA
jgi:hypothetical protein